MNLKDYQDKIGKQYEKEEQIAKANLKGFQIKRRKLKNDK